MASIINLIRDRDTLLDDWKRIRSVKEAKKVIETGKISIKFAEEIVKIFSETSKEKKPLKEKIKDFIEKHTSNPEKEKVKKDPAGVLSISKKEAKYLEQALEEIEKAKEKWKITQEEWEVTKEEWEVTKEDLFNRPGMTPEDNENMEKVIQFLTFFNMNTQENFKKLYAVKYGSNYREIDGLKFSREKVIPKVEFKKRQNGYDVFECKEKGIYKAIYNGKAEYYLTPDQYIAQAKKQGLNTIDDNHIRQALKALPAKFEDDNEDYHNEYFWGNVLSIILGLSGSGSIDSFGENSGYGGSLCCASPANQEKPRVYQFCSDSGMLFEDNDRDSAYPCLSLIK